jgi:hypothetical protein
MDHINDALNYKCPELPAASRVPACNEAHVNEVKTLELEPTLIGMDFAKDPSQTKLIERHPDGKLIVHDLSSLSEQELKQLISEQSQQQFSKAAAAVQELGDSFEKIGEVAVALSDDHVPRVSKHAHARTFPLPKKVWNHKKTRRKQQAQSRKTNRR